MPSPYGVSSPAFLDINGAMLIAPLYYLLARFPTGIGFTDSFAILEPPLHSILQAV